MSESDQVAILRWPCLPEDEDRVFFVAAMPRNEANAWIDAQAGQYFKPADYFTLDRNGLYFTPQQNWLDANGRPFRLGGT